MSERIMWWCARAAARWKLLHRIASASAITVPCSRPACSAAPLFRGPGPWRRAGSALPPRCGMPESLHQFGQGCAGRGGQHSAGMSQIVPAQIIALGLRPRLVPVPIQRRRLQVAAVLSWEDQRITALTNIFRKVRLDRRE